MTSPLPHPMHRCPVCEVGAAEEACWFCGGKMVYGYPSAYGKPDEAMVRAWTNFGPGPDADKMIELKSLDDLVPRLGDYGERTLAASL